MIHLLLIAMVLGGGNDRVGGRSRCTRTHNPYCGPMAATGSGCTPSSSGSKLVDGDWADFTNTAAPVRTVNYGPDPGCGSAAERVVFPATTSGQFASIQNTVLCPAATSPISMGCWIKGTSGAGTIDFCTERSGYTCHDMAFTAAFTFYKLENVSLPGGGANVIIGNVSAITGNARGSNDVQLFDCRCIAGTTISP